MADREQLQESQLCRHTEGKTDKAPNPGEWLDNPLPVPRRHEKKEMSYGFEPAPDQMFFDISVSEQDDFDI